MDGAADLGAEDVVDQLGLLDPRQALEPVRDYLGAKVIAAAGQILDAHLRAGKGRSDAFFKFGRRWH